MKCVCCGAKRHDRHNFVLEDGSLSRITKDHIVLHSLCGNDKTSNLSVMCERCNSLRSDKFAEQKEFIDWFHSENRNEKPPRNFSYIKGTKGFKRHRSDVSVELLAKPKVKPIAESKSILIRTFERDGRFFNVYKHPIFGISELEIKENA